MFRFDFSRQLHPAGPQKSGISNGSRPHTHRHRRRSLKYCRMSSAEAFGWGSLTAEAAGGHPTPLEVGRSGLVRQLFAGSGCAVLAGRNHVEWVSGGERSGVGDESEGGDDPRSTSEVEGVALGEKHTLLLRKANTNESETEVLAWGLGRQGELGLGAGILETKRPRPIPALSAHHVVQVACGAHHSAAVTACGDLFTWGRGIEGQLGHSSRHLSSELNDAISGVQFRPKPVATFLATKKRSRPVAGVSCGHSFTVVVTSAGEVWAFGEGAMGQLGVGRVTRASLPTVVMPACPVTGQPFVEVAAGWAHVLARTAGGGVFSWGLNALGSLGLGDYRTRFLPEAVALSDWSQDDGYKGQCIGDGGGDGNPSGDTTTASVVASKVHACGHCSGALTAEGLLLTWGCTEAGRLGHGGSGGGGHPQRVEHVCRPHRVEHLAKVQTSDFALSGGGGVALVPLRVKSIEPASGPLDGGCKVAIRGSAFWDSPDIVVKFTPVAKGHKPIAARSAVGTYAASGNSVGGDHFREENCEQLTCAAPCFASPEEAIVEVSIDGTSFTTDGTRFQYYRTPELTQITPGLCRPPFPRLRLDGKQIRPNDRLLVRFEEEEEIEEHSEGSPPAGDDNEQASLPPPPPRRTFDIPGRAESEIVQAGIDPETGLPIHEERWFIVCDAPAFPPWGELPFISRVTVAPNGANFRGEPLRFVAHDPWADACFPMAVPIPVVDGENPDGMGTSVRITGRNLYRGDGLAARLRFGRDKASVVPLDAVAFARGSETITGAVPVAAWALVAGKAGTAATAAACPPAISTVVEVSMDGKNYFAVPEIIILYRDPVLRLKGDGFFPIADGGVAELVPAGETFRGNEAKVRLVSDVHSFDVTLPLLSSWPPQEVNTNSDEQLSEATAGEAGGEEARLPAARVSEKKCSIQKEVDNAGSADERTNDSSSTGTPPDGSFWEEHEVLTSAESFFFMVPPLPKQSPSASVGDTTISGEDQGSVATSTSSKGAVGQQPQAKTQPTKGVGKAPSPGGTTEEAGSEQEAAVSEEHNVALSVLVSLNGNDWRLAAGPPLTYFQPRVEPVVEPDPAEVKRAKGKKK